MIKNKTSSSKSRLAKILPYIGVTFAVIAIASYGTINKDSEIASTMNMQSIASNDYAVSTDQISEFYTVSELANNMSLPTAEAVNVNYNSLTVMRDIGQTSSDKIEKLEKPDIVDTSHLSRGVVTYTIGEGESLASIAAKYGISETQLRWSNGLKNSDVSVGTNLNIPSVPGIVYTIKEGDTIDSLADKYSSSKESIITTNDLETSQSLTPGSIIILPNGELPETERPEYEAPRTNTYSSSSYSSSSSYRTYWTSSNPMPWGWCTWYAWERRSQMSEKYHLPGGLGNASTWASALSGTFRVDNTPRAGAVMQTTTGYFGHVAIVERVNSDGSVTYTDMNGSAGWGRVGETTISASQAASYRYIHEKL